MNAFVAQLKEKKKGRGRLRETAASRGGNRPERSTGAYGLAYLKPNFAQLI